jgi:fumarate reductase flavoprotein subunit
MTASMTRRSFAGLTMIAAGSVFLTACSSNNAATPATDEESADTNWKDSADLIVVGGGCAGLAAAAKAAQGGASVIVLEAQGWTGGTTLISGGHWKFMDTEFMAMVPERTEESDARLQEFLAYKKADFEDYGTALETLQRQIEEYFASDPKVEFDSLEYWLILHYLGTKATDLKGNKAVTPPYELVAPAYAEQYKIKDWLVEGGLEFEIFGWNGEEGGPLSVAPIGDGPAFLRVLGKYASEAGADIVTDSRATALIYEEDRVTGVLTENGDLYQAHKGVCLASGGFAANAQMVATEEGRFENMNAKGLGSCEPDLNDGTALLAAKDIGAATANLQFCQYLTSPASSQSSIGDMIPMCYFASVLCVNKEGVRFFDDTRRFAVMNDAISLGQTDNEYFLIGDASGIPRMGDLYDRFLSTGDLSIGDTIEEAAEAAGLDGATVAATVKRFNGFVETGEDLDFGRKSLTKKVEGAPYTIMAVREYVQHTMGGVVIDKTGHVVDESGNQIEGLYAAGEVVGILDGGNRRHGDNFAQILYYGCLIGDTIANA